LQSETFEGAGFIARSAGLAAEAGRKRDEQRLLFFAGKISGAAPGEVYALLHDHELEALMTAWADRSEGSEFLLNEKDTLAFVETPALAPTDLPKPRTRKKIAESKAEASKRRKGPALLEKGSTPPAAISFAPSYPRIIVDRPAANCTAWYEFFPRSAGRTRRQGSTFPRLLAASR
jgi:hypothetical protein